MGRREGRLVAHMERGGQGSEFVEYLKDQAK
jgi:hypothetical protein